MKHKHWTAVLTVAAGLALAATAALADGGARMSVPDARPKTPQEMAAEYYNQGNDHRDRAWKHEEKAEKARDDKDRAKNLEKAQKEYEKAIKKYEEAIKRNQYLYQAHSGLGYALRRTGQHDASLESYDRALMLQPDYTEAIEYRAEAYLGLNRTEDAKEAYLVLFRKDRERAAKLLKAMESWRDQRRADASVDQSKVDAFAKWIDERRQVASQMDADGEGRSRW